MYSISINENNLRRALGKEAGLSKKLITARKKREREAKKINRLNKKRSITTSDIQRLKRYQRNLLKSESEITKISEEIHENKREINRYQERVNKEQEKNFNKIIKSLDEQTAVHKGYTNDVNKLAAKLDELALEVKNTVKEKEIIEYDVFLSHSNLDKDIFVSELSEKLSSAGFEVFEDVKVFKIGDSQTDQMNMGILNSRFVIVFLSHNFMNSGWSEYEFKSFLNREINENRIIILPIWHDVTVEEVREYNPYLVDKFALKTDEYTLDEMVKHISQVIISSKEKE